MSLEPFDKALLIHLIYSGDSESLHKYTHVCIDHIQPCMYVCMRNMAYWKRDKRQIEAFETCLRTESTEGSMEGKSQKYGCSQYW